MIEKGEEENRSLAHKGRWDFQGVWHNQESEQSLSNQSQAILGAAPQRQ
jgi:hypothetical protein